MKAICKGILVNFLIFSFSIFVTINTVFSKPSKNSRYVIKDKITKELVFDIIRNRHFILDRNGNPISDLTFYGFCMPFDLKGEPINSVTLDRHQNIKECNDKSNIVLDWNTDDVFILSMILINSYDLDTKERDVNIFASDFGSLISNLGWYYSSKSKGDEKNASNQLEKIESQIKGFQQRYAKKYRYIVPSLISFYEDYDKFIESVYEIKVENKKLAKKNKRELELAEKEKRKIELAGKEKKIAEAKKAACLSGLCLGDNIFQSKVNWNEIDKKLIEVNKKEIKKWIGKVTPSSFDMVADQNIIENLAPYLVSGSTLAKTTEHLDKNSIKLLKSVKAFCKSTILEGRFKSSSGYRTLVEVSPMPSMDGKTHTLKVIKIKRWYGRVYKEDSQKLTEQLSQKYKPFIRHFVSSNATGEPIIWTQTERYGDDQVEFNLFLLDRKYSSDKISKKLRKHSLCASKVSID